MKHDGYTSIGTILNPHGYKGKISIFSNLKKNKDFKFPESIFVEIQQILIPFFVEEYSANNSRFIIKLKELNSEQEVLQLKKKEIFITNDIYNKLVAEDNSNLSLIGFEVYDKIYGLIGTVKNILEYPGQEIFEIRGLENEEILMPFSKSFIKKINKSKKTIDITAPEGLLDLYLKK